MKKDAFKDARTLIDSMHKCVDFMESQNSLYEREVQCLREEKSKLAERASQASEYACCMTRLANEKRSLKEHIDELEAENIGLREDAQNHLALADEYADESETWENRANELLVANDKLDLELRQLKIEKRGLESGIKAWTTFANSQLDQCMKLVDEKKELNDMLEQSLLNERKLYLESKMWKTILVCGLENVVEEFYIKLDWYRGGMGKNSKSTLDMVAILVKEDYDGEEPNLSGSPIDQVQNLAIQWCKNRDDYDALVS